MKTTHVKLFVAVLLGTILCGCVAVGKGTRTLIKAKIDAVAQAKAKELKERSTAFEAANMLVKKPPAPAHEENSPALAAAKKFFSHLVAKTENDADRVVVFNNNIEADSCISSNKNSRLQKFNQFESYLNQKYAQANPETAQISLLIRDLGRVPALSAEQQASALTEAIKIRGNKDIKDDDKIKMEGLLYERLLRAPQVDEISVYNKKQNTLKLFFYYPILQIEFSADVLSPNSADRFSQLIFLVQLTNDAFQSGVRFVNFGPKEVKGLESIRFNHGELTDGAETNIKGTYNSTPWGMQSLSESNNGNITTFGPATDSKGGGELGFIWKENLKRELKDAIERRTCAIIEGGQTFLVDLRAFRDFRIGGTYSFDLMLEIPSTLRLKEHPSRPTPQNSEYESVPIKKEVFADVVLIGVVRHVSKVGWTGVVRRGPESENDCVYEEVRLVPNDSRRLWLFNEKNVASYTPEDDKVNKVKVDVVTNIEEARYVVEVIEGTSFKVVDQGEGKQSSVHLKKPGVPTHYQVRFLDAIRTPATGIPVLLVVNPQPVGFDIRPDSEKIVVTGEYKPPR